MASTAFAYHSLYRERPGQEQESCLFVEMSAFNLKSFSDRACWTVLKEIHEFVVTDRLESITVQRKLTSLCVPLAPQWTLFIKCVFGNFCFPVGFLSGWCFP